LNLAAKGVTATAVGYFQNLNFYLPTNMTKNDTMLTVNTYEFNVTSDDNNIYATITKEPENTELQANTKSMVETRAASATILNAGADMLAGQGFQQAANAIAQAAESGAGQSTAGSMTPFAAIGSGMFELGWQVKPDASPLTLDLGLTAWAGKQRGLTGQLGMNWKF
jgi:hypothetical protein